MHAAPVDRLVSVVVPLYQKGALVERALHSIVAQSHDAWEAIVVDDGSTDDGPDRVRAFGDARVRLVTQANAGPGAARNRGIAEARGPLVAFLDADDEWLPSFLASAVAALGAPEIAAYVCAHVDEPPGRSTAPYWKRFGVRDGTYRTTPRSSVPLLVTIVQFMWTSAVVVRAERVRHHGGFVADGSRYGEDSPLMFALALHETLFFDLTARAIYHRGDSALNRRDRGARPVEPFLLDPSLAAAPANLRALRDDFLAARAQRTGAMLAYHGRWREGRAVVRRHATPRSWRLPLFAVATLATTPLGPVVGRTISRVLGRRRRG